WFRLLMIAAGLLAYIVAAMFLYWLGEARFSPGTRGLPRAALGQRKMPPPAGSLPPLGRWAKWGGREPGDGGAVPLAKAVRAAAVLRPRPHRTPRTLSAPAHGLCRRAARHPVLVLPQLVQSNRRPVGIVF